MSGWMNMASHYPHPKVQLLCFPIQGSLHLPKSHMRDTSSATYPLQNSLVRVFLDSKMTGVPHLNYVVNKCEKGINVLRALSGVWWGSHPYNKKLLYNALIRSRMDYGSFILEPCNKTALNKYDAIQAKCMRIILGAMKSSPKNALQVDCLDPPLSLRRQYLSDRFIFKAMSCSSHPLIPRLEDLSEVVSNNRYWYHKETPKIIKSFLKARNLPAPIYSCNINPLFFRSFFSFLEEFVRL